MTEPYARLTSLPGRLLGYAQGDLRPDAIAGLTVAVMGVPQAMAYALIAGLPPVYGLYTAIITCAVAALLGSSRHLVTGPTNALCMVILSLTAHLPQKYGVNPIEAILLLTLLTGLIQLGFGLLRLGGIIRYISRSVVIGFTAGAGVLIAVNQLKNVLGVDIAEAHAERSFEVLIVTIRHLREVNPYALAIGLATMLLVIAAPRINRRLPAAMLALVVTGVVAYLLGWHEAGMGPSRIEIVKDLQPISGSFPPLKIPGLLADPNYDLTRELGSGALALAILGLIEAASIARAVATSSNQRLDFTREFIAQGASNVAGAFFSCFAGSGSFTRTAVCYQSGGRTRMAATFSAVWTLVALLLLGPVANYIPKAGLAGLLIVIAYSMIDKQALRHAWRSGPSPRLVLVGTLLATLILPLEYAIFFGVFLSVVILLRTTGKTDLTQLVQRSDAGFDEVPFNEAAASPIVIVNMEGDLYFAAAGDLDYELLRCITPKTRVVVLRMKRLRAVGSTAMAMLEHFWEILRKRRIALVVCGIEDELVRVMTGSGLRQQIGEQNIFYADNRLFQSTELALARAWSLAEMMGRIERAPAGVREQGVGLSDEGAGELAATPSGPEFARARDIMSPRVIRFGNQHQLREAVWLMSELQRHTHALSPEPLFLQSRDGRLAGEISRWRILRALGAGIDHTTAQGLNDAALGEILRRDFTRPISSIARGDLAHLRTEDSIARLLEVAVGEDLQVLPICDEDGRIRGLVSQDDLLRWLDGALGDVREGDPQRDDPKGGETHGPPSRAITARDLMLARIARIPADATLHAARKALADLQADPAVANALVVIDAEGNYLGIITARLLLRTLFSPWPPGAAGTTEVVGAAGGGAVDEAAAADEDGSRERELLSVARDRSAARVGNSLPTDFPVAVPDDRLTTLIAIGGSNWVEYIPVVEGNRPLGLVPITSIFDAAASLALRPDDEGIWVGGKAVR